MMRHLLLACWIFVLPTSAEDSLESTRDWLAFSDFNTSVNSWLKEEGKEEVKGRYVKFLFFQFWLMYYGPDAYKDEEATAIRKYFEARYRGAKKKLDFMKSDITEMIGIKGIEEKELASAHCSSTLRLKKSGLTVGDVRGILRDFETWGAEGK